MSKTQLSTVIQLGGFLGRRLGPLLKTGLPLLKSAVKTLGMLGLTYLAAASATDAAINKKNPWIWNNDLNNFKRWNEIHFKNSPRF